MNLFVIVCLLVLTISAASTQCNSSKIYPLFVGSTLSNNTGVSFSGIAGGNSARVAVDGSASLSTQTANPKVDMVLESMRGKGHTSPAGHVFLPVKISSPLSDDPDRISDFIAIYDSGSAFNIIGEAEAESLRMPLGSECIIKWGGITVVSGRFGIARIHNLGEEPADFIFCVLPNPSHRIINDDTRRLLGFCVYGFGDTSFLSKCSCV